MRRSTNPASRFSRVISLAAAVLASAFAGDAPPAAPADLLAATIVPPEFDVTLFATPAEANYPASVAAAPDGTLYVASDANSSLGTDLGRGRIIRLRDTDGDGRADEVKPFAKMDSPRGLVWDIDRLYVMHPPQVSAFFDRDGDGVAEEQKILVKNIAFAFRDRPADHSSNGVTLGVDGWLYLAIGDFGFMEAEGTDGRKLQLRGGGVVRVRPDGTGLELFSRGTRNILEVALSPRLDGIARDNTNDGGGWDIRLHHFSGLEDHGYPTLFKNFAAEAVAPLADYGGGSGCGSAWIDEPGIPEKWNRAPFTVDWGRERIYRHGLTPNGATFTATQEEFAKLPRATDLDVDALSRLYLASWRGGQYNYGGSNVGYIVRLTPKDYRAPALPDFARLDAPALIALFSSPSARIRLEAQRRLLRLGIDAHVTALETLATSKTAALETRILALFTLKQARGEASHAFLARLASDSSVAAWALRALANHQAQRANIPDAPLLAGLRAEDARTRNEAAIALARLDRREHAAAATPLLGDRDPVVAHTAVQALIRLQAAEECLAIVDLTDTSEARRTGALRVLQALHDPKLVDQLIARLGREKDPARREGLVRTLCRLYYVEGKWTGDSWGTRPDTRGPYYQPERWAASEKINTVLNQLLERADGAELTRLNELFALHRVNPGDSVGRLIALAEKDETLLPALAQQLAGADTVPGSSVPLLQRALTWLPPPQPQPEGGEKKRGRGQGGPPTPPGQLAAMQALIKAATPEAIAIVLQALPTLPNRGRLGDGTQHKAANALFQSNALETHHRFFGQEAAKLNGDTSVWADAALLHIAARKFGSVEPRAYATQQLDDGWQNPARRAQIIKAAALGRESSRAAAIVQALADPDPAVAAAAKATVATLKIDAEEIRANATHAAPLISTLQPEDVLARVAQQRGSVARGEQVYAQAACNACHTVNASDPLKGPFLGTIARIYPQRRDLAEAILDPNKSISQGFATYQFTLKSGTVSMGFVTRESADVVSIRDIAGQQQEIRVADVAKRERLPVSLMPPGLLASFTVADFASLLDYLQSLAEATK